MSSLIELSDILDFTTLRQITPTFNYHKALRARKRVEEEKEHRKHYSVLCTC